MERMTFQQICEGLGAVNEWLSNLAIREEQDRIREHIRRIEGLEQARQAGVLNGATQGEDGRLAMFALTEAMEFLDIHAAFRRETPGLRRRLRAALQGPADPANESPDSNQARNVMFELNLASRLRSRGLPVGLPENPDILTEFHGVPIYIQCKRPFRETSIPGNIDDARRQLTRDLDAANDPRARGVIAISVSRVFNPGKLLYRGPNEATVKKGLGDEVQRLGEGHRTVWGGIQDARIVGIMFHIISPTVVEDIALLTVAQETVVFPLPGRPEADVELLRQFASIIGNS